MRRVLHVPACDLEVGDLVGFYHGKTIKSGESKVIEQSRDGVDGEIFLRFEDDDYTGYHCPVDQFCLLLERGY